MALLSIQTPASTGADLRRSLQYPAAALSGVLIVLAFPWYGQDYLIWIALVPLFWAAAGAGAKGGFLAGWLAGLTLVSGGFLWVLYSMRAFTGLGRAADLFLFWPWVLFESVPWALLGLVLGLLRSGQGRAAPARVLWALPFWLGIEHYFPHLFPWHLGGALYRRAWLVQCADLLGASGLTALVFLVNGVVFLALRALRHRARFPIRSVSASLLLLVGANLYGSIRLVQLEKELAAAPELKVGMVQPFTLPKEKMARDSRLFDKMETLTRGLSQRGPLHLVLWPEGADTIGYFFDREGRLLRSEMNIERKTGFENLAVPLVAGSWSHHEATGMPRNTAAYILPGTWPPQGFYHKNIRVVFGEYIPFLNLLPSWFRSKIEHAGTIEAGTECPRFSLPAREGPYRFRILICYEAVLPGYVRAAARGADFLVNVTEDIWYGNTAHIEQHLSVLMLRAVEERISIARSTNIGPSGVIDPAGRMVERTAPYEKSQRTFALRPVRLWSLYALVGPVLPATSSLVVLGFAGVLFYRRRVGPSRNL